MQFAVLYADHPIAKPAPVAPAGNWNLLANVPVLNLGAGAAVLGQFDVGLAPILPSVLGAPAYSEVYVGPASMVWDAVTVGYGFVADVQILVAGNPVQAQSVCRYAAARSRLLRSLYDFPAGLAPGPIRLPTYDYIETSERVVLSFLLGQTVAMRVAKVAWGVQRLFHRSLYGPLLPLLVPGAPALVPGLSPDFLCFDLIPVGAGGLGVCLVEAKGTNALLDPDLRAADRELINKAFRTQIAPMHNFLGGAFKSGVSVACRDAALAPDRVVGQFWDPPNLDAQPVPEAGVHALTAQYFLALHTFLLCLEAPILNEKLDRVVWEARSLGFHIEMEAWQWGLMENLAGGQVDVGDFFLQIQQLAPEALIDIPNGPNGDGLYLSFIED